MNYIGSKDRLIEPLIRKAIADIAPGIFADAFAGTHAVGRAMQAAGWRVVANDQMAFSYHLGQALMQTEHMGFEGISGWIFTHETPIEARLAAVIDRLNRLIERPDDYLRQHPEVTTWFWQKFGEGGAKARLYFSEANAKRICIVQDQIGRWRLNEFERSLLLSALIQAADKVANIVTVYGAYQKKLKACARKDLVLEVPAIAAGLPARVHCRTIKDFLDVMGGANVLYLDPPYNERQYAPNYHVLETIALWDDPDDPGVTGVRPWKDQKSDWCSRKRVHAAFTDVLDRAPASTIMLSYSSDGLMAVEEIVLAMKQRGVVDVHQHEYPRLQTKAGDVNKDVVEYLFVLTRS